MSARRLTGDSTTTAAFAFVAKHHRALWWSTYRVCAGSSMDRDEFHAELCVEIGEAFLTFEPERGSASNWIFMRARRLFRALTRRARRWERAQGNGAACPELGEDSSVQDPPLPDGARGHAGRTDARAVLVDLLRLASPTQRDAIASYLRDWSPERIRATFRTEPQRDAVLRSLGHRVVQREADAQLWRRYTD